MQAEGQFRLHPRSLKTMQPTIVHAVIFGQEKTIAERLCAQPLQSIPLLGVAERSTTAV
jgi:hypothetical protein